MSPTTLTDSQCHFFAGLASGLMRSKAGWADDDLFGPVPVPCQPFSSAGKGSAFADRRQTLRSLPSHQRGRPSSRLWWQQVARNAKTRHFDLILTKPWVTPSYRRTFPNCERRRSADGFKALLGGRLHGRDWIQRQRIPTEDWAQTRGKPLAETGVLLRPCRGPACSGNAPMRTQRRGTTSVDVHCGWRPSDGPLDSRDGRAKSASECLLLRCPRRRQWQRQQIAGSRTAMKEADGREGRDEQHRITSLQVVWPIHGQPWPDNHHGLIARAGMERSASSRSRWLTAAVVRRQ